MTLLSMFRGELVNAIQSDNISHPSSANNNSTAGRLQLVRLHDKHLAKCGDFSFPSPHNNKIWGNSWHQQPLTSNDAAVNPSSKSIDNIIDDVHSLPIDRIIEDRKTCRVFLDRAGALDLFFGRQCATDDGHASRSTEVRGEELGEFRVEMLDQLTEGFEDLSVARVACLAETLGRSLKHFGGTEATAINTNDVVVYRVGTNPRNNNDTVKTLQVGPVLGADGKKLRMSLADYTSKVLDNIRVMDEERCEPSQSQQTRDSRLKVLTTAQVRFDLLSTNPLHQCTLKLPGSSSSTFVLYNFARISQIIHSFEACVKKGLYPELPQQPDWALLQEEEEWELFFVYLLPYEDMLKDVVINLKIHRITLHLIGLSNCLSRYYSRVKILKDPLARLIPVMHARIFFLKEIQKVVCSSLDILGLQRLNKM